MQRSQLISGNTDQHSDGNVEDRPHSALNPFCRLTGHTENNNTQLEVMGRTPVQPFVYARTSHPSLSSTSTPQVTDRTRWSNEDIMKLVTAELSAPPAAARSINEYHHASVTLSRPRGLEAIKLLRRRDRYKSMLAHVQSSNSSPTLAINVDQSEPPNLDLPHSVTDGSVCSSECRRVFPSLRSLAQHRRHAHPPENCCDTGNLYNYAQVTRRVSRAPLKYARYNQNAPEHR